MLCVSHRRWLVIHSESIAELNRELNLGHRPCDRGILPLLPSLNYFPRISLTFLSEAIRRPCCMDHPEGCLIIVFFNTGDNLDAT